MTTATRAKQCRGIPSRDSGRLRTPGKIASVYRAARVVIACAFVLWVGVGCDAIEAERAQRAADEAQYWELERQIRESREASVQAIDTARTYEDCKFTATHEHRERCLRRLEVEALQRIARGCE